VLIQSFSKSHGPDLRIAAVGGTEAVVTPLVNRRTLGPGWTSRVLQSLIARMLDDARVIETVHTAREVYAERRTLMVDALHVRGARTTGTDGINLWIEARDEQAALLSLAAQGIGAAPGTPFITNPFPSDHLRVTVGLVRADHEPLAGRLADAVLGVGRRTTRPRARTS
jgi:DNA-binding transcriptional MocR family regulator